MHKATQLMEGKMKLKTKDGRIEIMFYKKDNSFDPTAWSKCNQNYDVQSKSSPNSFTIIYGTKVET